MAAIEKIRRHSGLLVAIIGIALLVFVLEDLFQSQGRGNIPVAAVVDGEKIFASDYNLQKEQNIKQAELNNRRNGYKESLSNDEKYNICNGVLDNMIREVIMAKEYNTIGLDITPDELYDQMTGVQTGKPHQWMSILQDGYFLNEEGGVDQAKVDEFLNEVLPQYPVSSEVYQWWTGVENDMRKNRLDTKFNYLVRSSYFLPQPLAQKYYEKSNVKASAEIIALRYTSIPDSLVVITDADNKAYYNAHKEEFKTDGQRDIEYVVFDVRPSDDDYNQAKANLEEMREGFATTDDMVNYLMAQGDQYYDSTWRGRKQVPQQIENVVFNNGVGYVTDVFDYNGKPAMARIMDIEQRYDSLGASHILIPFVGCANNQDTLTKEQAEAKANALLAQLKKNPKDDELFAKLAKENSSDPGSKDNGGKYENFKDGAMVPEFNEYVQNNAVGSLGIVETRFGYHIIKVTKRADLQPKVRLAYLTEPVIASEITRQLLHQEAMEFAANCKNYEQFNKIVEEQGLNKRTWQRIKKSDYQFPGMRESAREIVCWAFNDGKKGKIKEFNFLGDERNMVVVAVVTDVLNEGYEPLEVVAEREKDKIRNKKKGEMAVEKLKACDDVTRMINELHAETTRVPDLSFDSRNLSNFGPEESIIGIILGMKEGEEVGPIAGNSCAYIIKNVQIEQPAATEDYTAVISKQVGSFNSHDVYSALKNLTKIKDNRTQMF